MRNKMKHLKTLAIATVALLTLSACDYTHTASNDAGIMHGWIATPHPTAGAYCFDVWKAGEVSELCMRKGARGQWSVNGTFYVPGSTVPGCPAGATVVNGGALTWSDASVTPGSITGVVKAATGGEWSFYLQPDGDLIERWEGTINPIGDDWTDECAGAIAGTARQVYATFNYWIPTGQSFPVEGYPYRH